MLLITLREPNIKIPGNELRGNNFLGGEKGRRRDAVFFGLTSWPTCLETAVGSFPGLHRLEKKEGQGLDIEGG